MAEYCVKSESMGQELTQCAPVAQGKRKKRGSSVQPESLITIDLTDDQDTSESDSVSHLERQIEEISDVEPSIRHEDDSGNHDASRLESTTGSDSSLSEAESSHEVDDTHVDGVAAEIDDDEGKAAGPSECTLNEELSRLEQQNHLIQKPPLGQTEFSDWGELYHFLEAYMRSTFQVSSPSWFRCYCVFEELELMVCRTLSFLQRWTETSAIPMSRKTKFKMPTN